MPDQVKFTAVLTVYLIVEIVATLSLKTWVETSQRIYLISGLLLCFVCSGLWAVALLYEQLSRAGIIYTLCAMISSVAMGVILFKERLTPLNVVGVVLGCIAVLLVCSGSGKN